MLGISHSHQFLLLVHDQGSLFTDCLDEPILLGDVEGVVDAVLVDKVPGKSLCLVTEQVLAFFYLKVFSVNEGEGFITQIKVNNGLIDLLIAEELA